MNEQFPILIAETDAQAVDTLQRALREVGFNNPFHVSHDGDDIIRYLRGKDRYADRSRFRFPRILFLELDLPQCDGFEVLDWLQQHPECNVIPRIVWTASRNPEHVTRAYQLGVNSYLAKAPTFEGLVANLDLVFRYWEMCLKPELPPQC